MQIPSTSTAYGGGEAQRLLALLLQRQTAAAGQDLPSSTPASGAASSDPAADPPAPPPPPSGGGPNAAQFQPRRRWRLCSAPRRARPPPPSIAGQGDLGGRHRWRRRRLSLAEVTSALGQDSTSGTDQLGQAFAKLDANGDGKLSSDELSSALGRPEVGGQPGAGRGASRAPPPSRPAHQRRHGGEDPPRRRRRDNGDGELSSDEIAQAFGSSSSDQTSSLGQSLAKLDTNGDGQLNATELEAAIDAFRAAHRQGSTQTASTATTAAVTA